MATPATQPPKTSAPPTTPVPKTTPAPAKVPVPTNSTSESQRRQEFLKSIQGAQQTKRLDRLGQKNSGALSSPAFANRSSIPRSTRQPTSTNPSQWRNQLQSSLQKSLMQAQRGPQTQEEENEEEEQDTETEEMRARNDDEDEDGDEEPLENDSSFIPEGAERLTSKNAPPSPPPATQNFGRFIDKFAKREPHILFFWMNIKMFWGSWLKKGQSVLIPPLTWENTIGYPILFDKESRGLHLLLCLADLAILSLIFLVIALFILILYFIFNPCEAAAFLGVGWVSNTACALF